MQNGIAEKFRVVKGMSCGTWKLTGRIHDAGSGIDTSELATLA